MSRTIRKAPRKCFRKPKGKVNAIVNKARPGAVPPDAYDDLNHSDEAWGFYKVARRLLDKGWDEDKIISHIAKKYKAKIKFIDGRNGNRIVVIG